MPSGEKFYLRKVAPMLSSALAGHMPNALTKKAVDAWREQGVEGMEIDDVAELTKTLSAEELSAGTRETARLSRIVQQACVIPYLSNDDPNTIEFSEEWKAQAIEGLKEDDKDFDESTFDPKLLVVDPHGLDEADAEFLLYRWATGLVGSFKLKGGGVVHSTDVLNFRPKKLNRARAGANGRRRKSA